MGSDHRCVVTDGDVGQRGVRADGAATADAGAAEQLRSGLDDGVAADGHVDVDPGGRRVDDGDAGQLMGGHDAAVELGGQLGQLHPVVDAGHQRAVVDVPGLHHLPVLPDDRDDVGEVQLPLRVVSRQPAQRRSQRRDVEGVHAGVDFADFPLRRRRVGLLDDRDHLVSCVRSVRP